MQVPALIPELLRLLLIQWWLVSGLLWLLRLIMWSSLLILLVRWVLLILLIHLLFLVFIIRLASLVGDAEESAVFDAVAEECHVVDLFDGMKWFIVASCDRN